MQGGKNVYSQASHLFKNIYLYFVELRQRFHMEYKYQIHLFTFFTLFLTIYPVQGRGVWGAEVYSSCHEKCIIENNATQKINELKLLIK